MKNLIIFVAVALAVCVSFVVCAADEGLSEPAKTVLDDYVKIHGQLTKDSIKGVAAHAVAIAAAVKGDQTKSLPVVLEENAEALSKATNLAAAREAFKHLSDSLIKFLDDTKTGKGTYLQVYCPMAKASWLQTGKDIKNPYMGKDMLECGEIKN